ncbi:hypothetical protein [Succinimonas sp.]|uniref:hypothetical protein n=1 Tax=Succinimonas sp. TaxID=1936151 RepID=UPI003865EE57
MPAHSNQQKRSTQKETLHGKTEHREFPDAIRRSGRGFDIADVARAAPCGGWNCLVRDLIRITFVNN